MTELSKVAEDYLQAIWKAGEWSAEAVSIGGLAARLGLAPSTVSEGIRKLSDHGLVSHAKYGVVELTEDGRREALSMVRKHRLIETFLVEYLGYTWDAVHDEAEILEHAVSDDFVDRLDRRLGEPGRDPHGDPIPRRDGTLPHLATSPLSDVEVGARVLVVQISDADAELLRYFDELGIGLDDELVVRARHDAAGTLSVEHHGRRYAVGLPAARSVRVRSA